MHDDWGRSAHARAATSGLYTAQRSRAGGESCERCHAPLADADATRQLQHEGVGCVGCHLVQDVDEVGGGRYRANVGDNVMYGSICDAKNHYFHKMGCSPLHEEARFCGACHQLRRELPEGSLAVYTEYEEWAAGPAAAKGIGCQECHMPSETVAVAEGEAVRPGVGHHGFLGLTRDLRRRALRLEAKASGKGRVRVEVAITNEGAGHRVPSGSPERRLVLRARTLGNDGREIGRAERTFGRRLVDAAGQAAPFWTAVRVAADERIAPGETRRETFELDGSSAGVVHVEVLWRAADPEVVSGLGIPAIPEELMAETRLPIEAEGP